MAWTFRRLNHIHIVVDDLDEAAGFYREVLGLVEMQSHEGLVNRGLATYYGRRDRPESLRVSLRLLVLPDVATFKLVKIEDGDYKGAQRAYGAARAEQPGYGNGSGIGPVSVVVDDLDQAYVELLRRARDYSSRFRMKLLSEPTYLSPLQPHEIGATKFSALHGEDAVLADLAERFSDRAKFMMVDPFGVQWEFNNDVF
jgi:catechol 2,3-dioxygenase-like lactoylglutathione lyase family enzyme